MNFFKNIPDRAIVIDTETTGTDPKEGHRIVEIGAVEIVNGLTTGVEYHQLINPQRSIPLETTEIHGITDEMVRECPTFQEIKKEFLSFIGTSYLVAHNASFDAMFINNELTLSGDPEIDDSRWIDTLAIARKIFPGAKVSLDALCKRYKIDLSGREKHGALIDSNLLALVYIELMGGRQHGFNLAIPKSLPESEVTQIISNGYEKRKKIVIKPDEFEIMKHKEFIKEKIKNPIFLKL